MSYQKENNSSTCTECGGKCCKFILLECYKDDQYKIEFWEVQGNTKLYETESTVVYQQKSPCQHIDESGKCKIYEDRPLLCQDFPKQTLPRLWRAVCPLFHEREKHKDSIFKVFKTTE